MLSIRWLLVICVFMIVVPVAYAQEDDFPPLTETYTSEETSLTFAYPQGWAALGVGGQIFLASHPDLLESDSSDIPPDEIVIFILANLADLSLEELNNLGDSATPMEVLAIVSDAMAVSEYITSSEKIVVGGRSAAFSHGSDGELDVYEIAKYMPSREIVILLAITRADNERTFDDVLLAIAETLRFEE